MTDTPTTEPDPPTGLTRITVNLRTRALADLDTMTSRHGAAALTDEHVEQALDATKARAGTAPRVWDLPAEPGPGVTADWRTRTCRCGHIGDEHDAGECWALVRRDGECLRWAGAHTPTGYGHVSINDKRRAVHRVAYELHYGPIPAGYEVDHKCGVRDCYRLDHLEAVTHAENIRRGNSPAMVAARRATCANGHPKTPEHLKPYRDCRGVERTRCRTCFNDQRRAARRAKHHD